MTAAIAAGTILVVSGILLISWRAGDAVEDFRLWYVAAPLLTAILGGGVYPLRRYALRFSHEQIYFGAVVGVVGFLCVCIYLALPTTKESFVWNRASLGYFIAGGALESLGLLLVFYALTFGPVILVTPMTATLPLWVVLGGKFFLRDVNWASLVLGKVNIATLVEKSSSQLVRNQTATYETLVIDTFLDVPDLNLLWHMRCSTSLE